jgi:NADPH:quinone reductase
MADRMRAVAIDRFGGIETLALRELPVPEIAPDEVLIRIESAGVGEWDPFERQGGYAEMLGQQPRFPYVLGSEGAGVAAAVGAKVSGVKEGDRVYAVGFLNAKGGFYAEYAAVKADHVARIPRRLTAEAAGAVAGVGLTALRGLEDVLGLKADESIMIFGAGGGIGHIAVQLARRMGARVLAVASGEDGVSLAKRLGADAAVNGRGGDVAAAARSFSARGLDAVLLTAGGEVADQALSTLRQQGRAAFPSGVQPEPQARPGLRLSAYHGEPDPDIIARFDRLLHSWSLEVHIAHTFPLSRAADAHRALDEHYLGKLALKID